MTSNEKTIVETNLSQGGWDVDYNGLFYQNYSRLFKRDLIPWRTLSAYFSVQCWLKKYVTRKDFLIKT